MPGNEATTPPADDLTARIVQAEDNYVNPMACGHEHDDVEQLAPGTIVRCSAHGQTYITDGRVPGSGIIGRYVIQAHDDRPVPLFGIITGQIDADRVVVVWDTSTFANLAEAVMRGDGRIEFTDMLMPR